MAWRSLWMRRMAPDTVFQRCFPVIKLAAIAATAYFQMSAIMQLIGTADAGARSRVYDPVPATTTLSVRAKM
jgi:hypothetical protein